VHLSTLTKINTGILILIAVVLSSSLVLGINALTKPVEQLQSFSDNRAFLENQVTASLSKYLRSGDSQNLSAAEESVKELIANLKQNNPKISAELITTLTEFLAFLEQDARAAGKLAGNEQGLLLQNERETKDELASLIEYANEGQANNPALAKQYQDKSQQLMLLLLNRSMQRQQSLNAGSSDLTQLSQINREMQNLVTQIDELDGLGVFNEVEEEEDSFESLLGGSFDEEEEVEDKVEEIVSNLRSLVNRYLKEFENTTDVIRTIDSSYTTINSNIEHITRDFSKVEQLLSEQFSEVIAFGRNIMIVIIVLIVFFSFVIDNTQRGIAKRIRNFVPFLHTYSKGDFRDKVNIDAKTFEVNSLKESANTLRANMVDLIGDVKSRSHSVLELGQEVKNNSEQVAHKMSQQLQQTISISAAIEEMTVSFKEVAASSIKTASSANDINDLAKNSSDIMTSASNEVQSLAQAVDETSLEISKLGSLAENISSVLEVISGIAEQTNLLALNAAIEAARAGESGRGFAVVADEVRTLSKRTEESTVEIRNIIDEIQKQAKFCTQAMDAQVSKVNSTVDMNSQANQAVTNIVQSINSVKEMITQIAVSTEQQVKVADEISHNVHQVRDTSEETKSASNTTSTLSDRMQLENQHLQTSVGKFIF
jgi:methyl-accepting chemotaxis protein